MGFNAGGANVGGVQAIEQGELTGDIDVKTSVSTTQTSTFTCPVGKKWIIKGFSSSLSASTLTYVQMQIIVGGNTLYYEQNTLGSGQNYGKMMTVPLILSEGNQIKLITAFGAATINLTHRCLYMELDA